LSGGLLIWRKLLGYGLAFLLSEAEMKKLDLSPEELIAEIKAQWMADLSFLSRSHFEIYHGSY
jgi:hypothetical protein